MGDRDEKKLRLVANNKLTVTLFGVFVREPEILGPGRVGGYYEQTSRCKNALISSWSLTQKRMQSLPLTGCMAFFFIAKMPRRCR